ncbi:hypothetical protein ESCAB7627_3253 [Escherichia albertii TW07627]|uniref:Uncharacterized protein n=1 Tax=Escherichia albertii (strain TW07627) TaxID=502347 RepID=A0ABC9NN73_ESCAT|nr:hypothetical protein ESCAB7627_3253 [Escherichia albertii TW07627]
MNIKALIIYFVNAIIPCFFTFSCISRSFCVKAQKIFASPP